MMYKFPPLKRAQVWPDGDVSSVLPLFLEIVHLQKIASIGNGNNRVTSPSGTLFASLVRCREGCLRKARSISLIRAGYNQLVDPKGYKLEPYSLLETVVFPLELT